MSVRRRVTALLIVCAEPSPARFRTALAIALTHAALGGEARVVLDALAVELLYGPVRATDDAAHHAAGLPTLAELVDEAFAGGVAITACQSGVAMLSATPADFDPRLSFGGLPGAMALLNPEDRLLVV